MINNILRLDSVIASMLSQARKPGEPPWAFNSMEPNLAGTTWSSNVPYPAQAPKKKLRQHHLRPIQPSIILLALFYSRITKNRY